MAVDLDPNFPYGLDRPKQARATAGLGMALGVATLVVTILLGGLHGSRILLVLALLLACLAAFVVSGGLFRTSSKTKVAAVDRMLDELDLRGDERAVDLGCGTGLLCAGLAVRLPRGHVTGIDAWVESDLTPTGRPLAKRTLQLAGVKGVTVLTGSIRDLPLGDGGFDLVVSRDAVSMLPPGAAREEVVAEIARVLVPGGRVALLEPSGTGRLVEQLRAAGFRDVRRSRRRWNVMPPHRLVTATR